MPTPRLGSLVSLASALSVSLLLGGCATVGSHPTGAGVGVELSQPVVRFDNGGRDHVHVYLLGQKREWLLGRVEPGARTTLRIPEDALSEDAGSMRLVVIPGGVVTQRAAADPRASITLAQPTTEILEQRWSFSQRSATGELVSLRRGGR